MPPLAHPAGSEVAGRKVMVVDDDIRSLFAISALLKRVQIEVLAAERGRRGVDLLRQTPDVDLALVDIMMPGMAGFPPVQPPPHPLPTRPKPHHLSLCFRPNTSREPSSGV